MKRLCYVGCMWLTLVMLAGCGADQAERAAEEAARAGEEAARLGEEAARRGEEAARLGEEAARQAEGLVGEALSAAREALTDGRNVEPVDAGTLQALLPPEVEGLQRTATHGEREGAMGFFITTARGEYTGNDGTIEVVLVDLGGVTNPAMFGYAWTEKNIRRDYDGGYERTVTFKGYRAHEQYDARTERGKMAVIVADRFIVGVEGEGVPMTALKDALSRLDLDRLAAMRDVGVQVAE